MACESLVRRFTGFRVALMIMCMHHLSNLLILLICMQIDHMTSIFLGFSTSNTGQLQLEVFKLAL